MRRLLPLALLAGCNAHAIPIALMTQDEPGITTKDEAAKAVVDEAADILGYGIDYHTGRISGVIGVEILDCTHCYPGRKYPLPACHRIVRCTPNASTCAHEIAHALGLEHYDVDGNLMKSIRGEDDDARLEDWQRDELWDGVKRLQRCTTGGR